MRQARLEDTSMAMSSTPYSEAGLACLLLAYLTTPQQAVLGALGGCAEERQTTHDERRTTNDRLTDQTGFWRGRETVASSPACNRVRCVRVPAERPKLTAPSPRY